MKKALFFLLLMVFSIYSNAQADIPTSHQAVSNLENPQIGDFILTFGSCNKVDLENKLWDDILLNKPDVWIWGGDNIYADTGDMDKLQKMYNLQKQNLGYQEVMQKTKVIGTWDDHDYGLNDGGVEWKYKKESEQLFLDFMDVPKDDTRRSREGVYHAVDFTTPKGKIKVLVLDTRYFRSSLEKSPIKNRRYEPTSDTTKTVLGEEQWQWLENELNTSDADFNILISSVQFLSNKHGFEMWGNFPNEVTKLENVIVKSKAKNAIILSGDRHIAEFSEKKVKDLPYSLVDFTSSGLTHVYKNYSGEENPYRIGEVYNVVNFGVLRFDFDKKSVVFEIRGDENKLLEQITRNY
ncbi:MAG: alkaline phosphatase [Bacteroidetes bacterium HGW-Bacteroidetes-13]|nr:MAG: alkaline phosphatase [Bacteroidetes bacterium HGW-Bacteroidetes-13]